MLLLETHDELPLDRIIANPDLDPETVRQVLNRAVERSTYVGLVREDVWTVKPGIVMAVDVAGAGFEREKMAEY